MVKHIVLFKLKETLSPAEKADIMNRFKTAIEALPATIPFIRDIHVGLNEHPAHVAAAGILKDAKENRACVDYTI